MSIRDFSLRDEEALARIFARRLTKPSSDSGPAPSRLTAGEVQLDRLQASFVRNSGRLDIREALIVGNQVGHYEQYETEPKEPR